MKRCPECESTEIARCGMVVLYVPYEEGEPLAELVQWDSFELGQGTPEKHVCLSCGEFIKVEEDS